MFFLDLEDIQIHCVSTTPSPPSSGALWQFVKEFHSNPDSDIELVVVLGRFAISAAPQLLFFSLA